LLLNLGKFRLVVVFCLDTRCIDVVEHLKRVAELFGWPGRLGTIGEADAGVRVTPWVGTLTVANAGLPVRLSKHLVEVVSGLRVTGFWSGVRNADGAFIAERACRNKVVTEPPASQKVSLSQPLHGIDRAQ